VHAAPPLSASLSLIVSPPCLDQPKVGWLVCPPLPRKSAGPASARKTSKARALLVLSPCPAHQRPRQRAKSPKRVPGWSVPPCPASRGQLSQRELEAPQATQKLPPAQRPRPRHFAGRGVRGEGFKSCPPCPASRGQLSQRELEAPQATQKLPPAQRPRPRHFAGRGVRGEGFKYWRGLFNARGRGTGRARQPRGLGRALFQRRVCCRRSRRRRSRRWLRGRGVWC
jgi:hypothetical protein